MAERERNNRDRDRNDERDSEFVDRLVHINRVAKVVKGGRRFGFAALVVVGDQKGRVGYRPRQGARSAGSDPQGDGSRQARPGARARSRKAARCTTTSSGRWGAGRVHVRTAPAGTGIIAGGPMRAVFETLGVQDVVAKSLGSSNPYNMIRATFDAAEGERG